MPDLRQPLTFLWHDYETFGAQPRSDRPAQFAALRTDAQLEVMGEPITLYCQPAPDYLPDPEACLITGITPQTCWARGVPEAQFAAQIAQALGSTGTVGVGYNSLRFDDEVTRFLLWRNLIDPYAREWKNDCGRWDLLDVVRTAYALRPQGLQWPCNAEGRPSFKLTDLTAANGIAHDSAHDALSDVYATLGLARLLRQAQPKLFDYALALRKKDRVAQELGLPTDAAHAQPFWHVSGMFAPERGCLALMWPLATHPNNRNELLAWDLAYDPRELADLKAEQIRHRLFTRSTDLPEGVQRLAIKSVHLNKSPMVGRHLGLLTPEVQARWGLDLNQGLAHAMVARDLPDLSAIWAQVFARTPGDAPDVDEDLYGGFVSEADRRRLEHLRHLPPAELALQTPGFDDARLAELVWRYRARNHPNTLSPDEARRWAQHCRSRVIDGAGGARRVSELFDALDRLADTADEAGQDILGALYDYAESVVAATELD
ncbi:MAG: exodeoxyribonuclease I [Rhodoferax sp.]